MEPDRAEAADLSVLISQRRLDFCISSPGKIPSGMAEQFQQVFYDSDTKHRKSLLMEVKTLLDLTAAESQTGQENSTVPIDSIYNSMWHSYANQHVLYKQEVRWTEGTRLMTEPRPTLSNLSVNLNHWEQCVCQALSCVSVSHAFRLCKHLHRNEMGDFMRVLIYWVKKSSLVYF